MSNSDLIVGIVSGFVASILVWVWQLLLRPVVRAAPKVLVHNGKLSLKIVNKTVFRPIVDIDLALSFVSHPNRENGDNIADFEVIRIKRNKILAMKQRGLCHDKEQGAWVIPGLDPFTKDVRDGDYIRLQVVASETWFGFRRVFIFDYDKSKMEVGLDFERGRSLKIRKS
ncbi:MAG: hypothetical protein KKA55_08150 [Proteobacteria bacterium]|nr:hypothetical protein [Pseudomonadota bacterium]MBU1595487.1 hypothetical protein [Pseudomonadota bacterium]